MLGYFVYIIYFIYLFPPMRHDFPLPAFAFSEFVESAAEATRNIACRVDAKNGCVVRV